MELFFFLASVITSLLPCFVAGYLLAGASGGLPAGLCDHGQAGATRRIAGGALQQARLFFFFCGTRLLAVAVLCALSCVRLCGFVWLALGSTFVLLPFLPLVSYSTPLYPFPN